MKYSPTTVIPEDRVAKRNDLSGTQLISGKERKLGSRSSASLCYAAVWNDGDFVILNEVTPC